TGGPAMEAHPATHAEYEVLELDEHITSVALRALPGGRATRSVPASDKLDEDGRRQRTREDRRLLLRYHEHGDTSAREELVERFLPLARQLARRYQRTNEPLDDLMQVASVGLVKAIDRFDPARGTAFSTYAVPTI